MEPVRNESVVSPVEAPKPTLKEVGYEAGKVRYEKMVSRVEALRKLAFTALGAPEMGGEAVKRGWEATVAKANEVKAGIKERVDATKEAARLQREKAVDAFMEKTRPIREYVSEKRDRIVDKAKLVGTAAAMTVAAGAELVVYTVDWGVGTAKSGANAVDSAIRWTLAEAQAKPRELRAGIHEGLAGMARETAKALKKYSGEQKAVSENQRARAAAIRARYGLTA